MGEPITIGDGSVFIEVRHLLTQWDIRPKKLVSHWKGAALASVQVFVNDVLSRSVDRIEKVVAISLSPDLALKVRQRTGAGRPTAVSLSGEESFREWEKGSPNRVTLEKARIESVSVDGEVFYRRDGDTKCRVVIMAELMDAR